MDLSLYLPRLRIQNNSVFDPVRKKWLRVQPEELVRQALLLYLLEEKKVAIQRMAVEKMINVNHLKRRLDLVYHDKYGNPYLLVECKSPSVPLTNQVLEQAIWYNFEVKAPYLLLSNGSQSLWYEVLPREKQYRLLDDYGPDL